jgi:hypothetical protein
MQFSIFYGGATNTKPNGTATLSDVIKLVKHDSKIKSLVEQIRIEKANGNNTKAAELKIQLPYITPYGLFTERNNQSFVEYSYNWIFAVDIDYKDNIGNGRDMDAIYQDLIKLDSVIIAFKSPSGNGLKALVKIQENSFHIQDHYEIYKQIFTPLIERKLRCKIDQRQGVLSQPFFLTHDSDLYYNHNYTELITNWTQLQKPMQTQTKIINGQIVQDPNVILQDFYTKIQGRELNKWDYFNKMAILAGGMYAGGQFPGVDKADVLMTLQNAAKDNPFVDDLNVAYKQILNGFDFGTKQPVTKDLLEQRKGLETLIRHIDKTDEEIIHDNVFNNNRFIRVGDDYFERIDAVSMNGNKLPIIEKRSRQTILDDFGKGFLKEIPKFKSFCNVPSYIDYKPVIDDSVNLFYPFQHEAIEGEFPTILGMLKHIFDSQLEMGLDYIQLLYQKPMQILPVLCLVSKENATGKTSFLEFLEMLFRGNTAIISTADIEGDFNQHYISKHIIMVDESDLHKINTASKIKQMATQKTTFVKGKFQQERKIDFFGKLILVSNDERGFLSIKDEDIRYWVRKIKPLGEAFDPDFNLKVMQEIPAFVFMLSQRQLNTAAKQSRAWFRVEDIETEATKAAKDANKSDCYFALFDAFVSYFERNMAAKEIVATLSDFKLHLLTGDKFSGKYIGKTLREEFKIDSHLHRNKSSFDVNQYTAKESGKFWVIERDWFYTTYNIPIEEVEPGLETNENVIKLDIKPNAVQDQQRDGNGEYQGKVPF